MVQTLGQREAKARYYQKLKKKNPEVLKKWNKKGHKKYYEKNRERLKKEQRKRYLVNKIYNLENERLVKKHGLK